MDWNIFLQTLKYVGSSVTRLGNLLHFRQLFKACGNYYFAQIAQILVNFVNVSKSFFFLLESFLGNFYRHFGDFLLVILVGSIWGQIRSSTFLWFQYAPLATASDFLPTLKFQIFYVSFRTIKYVIEIGYRLWHSCQSNCFQSRRTRVQIQSIAIKLLLKVWKSYLIDTF